MDAAVAAHTTLLAPAFATDDLFVTSDFTAGVGPEFDALMRASPARTDLRVTVMIGPEILFDIGDGYPEAPFAQRVLGALRGDAEDRGATPPDAFVHPTPIGAGLSLLAVAYGPTLGYSDELIRNFELPESDVDFLENPVPLFEPVLERICDFFGETLAPRPEELDKRSTGEGSSGLGASLAASLTETGRGDVLVGATTAVGVILGCTAGILWRRHALDDVRAGSTTIGGSFTHYPPAALDRIHRALGTAVKHREPKSASALSKVRQEALVRANEAAVGVDTVRLRLTGDTAPVELTRRQAADLARISAPTDLAALCLLTEAYRSFSAEYGSARTNVLAERHDT